MGGAIVRKVRYGERVWYAVSFPGYPEEEKFDTLAEVYARFPSWRWLGADPLDYPEDVILIGE